MDYLCVDMKKLSLIIAAFLMAGFSANAGKLVDGSVESTILGATVSYRAYLPNGFEKSDRQYPVVYLLHGLWDDFESWETKGRMSLVADELIESGECVPCVIVMPNAGGKPETKPWYGYFNMPGWSYENFFFKEFMTEVEKRYRIVSDKEHRAIMGLSMGGGGSTVYCQKHPECFSSCYAMSAWLDNKDGKVKGNDPKVVLVRQSVSDNSALDFISNATDETIRELKTVKWLFDCGDDDFLLRLSMDLHLMMRKAGIPSELRVHNGKHNWEYWHMALRDALPYASRNFGK